MHGLLSEKTVLYVTHQVEFLNTADIIVVSSVFKSATVSQDSLISLRIANQKTRIMVGFWLLFNNFELISNSKGKVGDLCFTGLLYSFISFQVHPAPCVYSILFDNIYLEILVGYEKRKDCTNRKV